MAYGSVSTSFILPCVYVRRQNSIACSWQLTRGRPRVTLHHDVGGWQAPSDHLANTPIRHKILSILRRPWTCSLPSENATYRAYRASCSIKLRTLSGEAVVGRPSVPGRYEPNATGPVVGICEYWRPWACIEFQPL